jgi:translation elongation factor EF-1alpha
MWLTSDSVNVVTGRKPGFEDSVVAGCWPCTIVNAGRYESMIAVITSIVPSTQYIYVNAYSTQTSATTTGSTGNMVPFNIRSSASSGAGGDVLSARTQTDTKATITASSVNTTACYQYIIEIKSSDVPAGFPYIALAISTGATASTNMSVTYYMKPRYEQKDMWTAIS